MSTQQVYFLFTLELDVLLNVILDCFVNLLKHNVPLSLPFYVILSLGIVNAEWPVVNLFNLLHATVNSDASDHCGMLGQMSYEDFFFQTYV